MTEDPESPHAFRETLLRDVFPKLDAQACACLVGILYEHRVIISKSFWSILNQHSIRIPLEPLEPQEAAQLVGGMYGHDCDSLYLQFHKNWITLRQTPIANQLVLKFQSHEHVDRLKALPENPFTS